MTDADRLAERLDAVERALTDSDRSLDELEDAATVVARLDALADRLDQLEKTVAAQEAGLQAVRGYVGNVKAVNDDVQARADAAMEKALALEASEPDDGRPNADRSTFAEFATDSEGWRDAATPVHGDEPSPGNADGTTESELSHDTPVSNDDHDDDGDTSAFVSRLREAL